MNDILVFGHKNPDTDSVCSAILMANLQNKLGNNAKAVVLNDMNKETQFVFEYLNINKLEKIESIEPGQRVMLVDHNGFAQSVSGIENANIIGVVDHHNVSGFETGYPLFYRAEPLGCTATIMYKMYNENNIEITREDAILMLSGIISDTLLFKSPTATDTDKQIAEKLAKQANIDLNEYGMKMLEAGTNLNDYTADQIINLDSKEYNFNGTKSIIAQVNTASIPEVLKRQEEIEIAMKNEIDKKELGLFLFAITDIVNCNSEAIVLGDRVDIAQNAYNLKLENNRIFLPGVVSRKKEIIPVLTKNS